MKNNEKIIEDNLKSSAVRKAPTVLDEITNLDICLPDWAYGPFSIDDSLTFNFLEQWKPTFEGDAWKCKAIFNPTLIEKDDSLFMFYRACPELESLDSRIGLAIFKDGKWEDYHNNPILCKQTEYEDLGLEDPKIYLANGKYYLYYNAISNQICPKNEMSHTPYGDIKIDLTVAVSDDLINWTKTYKSIVPINISKGIVKGAVIPRNSKGEAVKINGEYLMFLSVGCGGGLFVGHSQDMLNWSFTENRYLDMAKYGQIQEVACATTEEEWDYFILDVYYMDLYYDQKGAQVYYKKIEPYVQKQICASSTFSWGGMMKFKDKWTFAQGWQSPRDKTKMYLYTENKKGVKKND